MRGAHIREKNSCNPNWRHCERREGGNKVCFCMNSEIHISEKGRAVVENHWLGGFFATR